MYRSGVRPQRISSPLNSTFNYPPPVNSLYISFSTICTMCHVPPYPPQIHSEGTPLIGYAALRLISPTPFATCLFGMHHRTSCPVSSLALKMVSRHGHVGEPPSSNCLCLDVKSPRHRGEITLLDKTIEPWCHEAS